MCSVSMLAPRPLGVGSLYKVRVFGNNLQEVFTTFFRCKGMLLPRKFSSPKRTYFAPQIQKLTNYEMQHQRKSQLPQSDPHPD